MNNYYFHTAAATWVLFKFLMQFSLLSANPNLKVSRILGLCILRIRIGSRIGGLAVGLGVRLEIGLGIGFAFWFERRIVSWIEIRIGYGIGITIGNQRNKLLSPDA